jgi:uncharacterized protein (TIRG00374 family)
MKKKLGALARVLVSVGILAYLFNSIFRDEASRIADRVVQAPQAAVPALARELGLKTSQVELILTRCVDPQEKKADLSKLDWRERERFIWNVGPPELGDVFRRVNLWWFALGIACMGLVCYFGIVRWQWILRVQGLDIRFWRATSIFFIGMFFNAFMLGSTGGDVIKAVYVAHETHHKKAEAVATVVVDRVIGLLVLFVIALVMMAFNYARVFDDVRLRSFAIITLVVVVATVGGTALTFWRGFPDKFFGLRGWLQRLPKYDTLCRMVEACRMYASHPVVLGKTTLITVGVHVFSMLSIVCVGKGLGIITDNGMVDYFLYLPIINSVTAIPITISGFGVREGMYVKMFSQVGVASSAALALSLLGYIAGLFWSLVGANFYLTHRQEVVAAEQDVAVPE